jgi:hypothetical protein
VFRVTYYSKLITRSIRSYCILLLVSCVLLIVCLPAIGSDRYAAEFLNLGVGARPLGMGGSFVAVADDATATYWNPAGLGGLKQTEVSFMHASVFGLDSHDFLNLVLPIGKSGSMGFSWIRLGIEDIPITALNDLNYPYITGYMKDNENALITSYGRNLKVGSDYGSKVSNIQIGGNFKFLYYSVHGIERNAIGFGSDFGLIWRTSFISKKDDGKSGELSLGITAQDLIGTKIVWNTTSEPSHADSIPVNFKMGAAYSYPFQKLGSQILFSIDADTRYSLEMHYGVEYVIGDVLSLRAGLKDQDFTAGAGLHLAFKRGDSTLSFLIDYAFLSHELGNTHRISLMTKF